MSSTDIDKKMCVRSCSYSFVITCVYAYIVLSASVTWADAIPVELRETERGWQLFRDGKPYFIRGAGGDAPLDQLAAAGANSIRTWGGDDIDALLDEAHALGLSVTVGIWLGHERHGFDYADEAQVQKQMEYAREIVLKYKDHPAVLLWGIGNEMEGFESGDNPAIWKAVNDIAAMVKQTDPAHPTMTVTAEIGGERIKYIHQRCPAIDIHGINSYGGAVSLADRYRQAGASKPYVLTEFGPPGSWESATTEWGAPFELTSTEKAAAYRRHYEHAVANVSGLAIGSYVFTWGYKMEATATWFGMFLPDGARLGAVDVMTEVWSGRPPEKLVPTLQPLLVAGEAQVAPGAIVRVSASITSPEQTPLRVRWVLRRESGDYNTCGDYRPMSPEIEGVVLDGNVRGASIRMPEEPGPYRLYLYAYNAADRAATANVPLLVKGEVRMHMPFTVYEDGFEGMPWVPSGWMGAHEFLTVDGQSTDNPHEGKHCIKMRYTGMGGWVGVAWQDPANNWGEQDGGYNLSGATHLELWARGKYASERISIGVGLLGEETTYPDSGKAKLEGIVLNNEWQRYRIPLRDIDLSSIKTGFVVTISGRQTSVTVYLDSIRFVRIES